MIYRTVINDNFLGRWTYEGVERTLDGKEEDLDLGEDEGEVDDGSGSLIILKYYIS